MTGEGVLVNRANSADTSNQFVERFNGDTDGLAPWTNAFPGEIGGFRFTTADTPTGSGNGSTTTSGKKCKKKKHRAASAKKHCKKKHK